MILLILTFFQEPNENFRSYVELKDELAAGDLDVKSDLQIMRELMDRFGVVSDEKKVEILAELEYHVHQVVLRSFHTESGIFWFIQFR